MTSYKAMIALALLAMFATPADARHHQQHYKHQRLSTTTHQGQVVSNPEGCPRSAFCGCGSSVKVFGHPVRDLYLASNWSKFPSAAPAPGMAAWRHGHVFIIEQVLGDGMVMAYDPNSGGHQTRVHARSLAGFHVVNPHGGQTEIASRHPHDVNPRQGRKLHQYTQYADLSVSFDRFRPQ